MNDHFTSTGHVWKLRRDQIIDMNSHFLSDVYCASEMEGWKSANIVTDALSILPRMLFNRINFEISFCMEQYT